MKTVLITGASSGFGKRVAEKLLDEGYTVYAAARRVEKMTDLEAKGGHILRMDVIDNRSVEAGVDQVIKEQGRIDVLFNNAGYGSLGPIECVPMEDIQRQYEVNVFGMARLIKAVLPHMRKKRSGLIINTASSPTPRAPDRRNCRLRVTHAFAMKKGLDGVHTGVHTYK